MSNIIANILGSQSNSSSLIFKSLIDFIDYINRVTTDSGIIADEEKLRLFYNEYIFPNNGNISLALTAAGGYKTGKLYSVLPTNGSGDFAFTGANPIDEQDGIKVIDATSSVITLTSFPLPAQGFIQFKGYFPNDYVLAINATVAEVNGWKDIKYEYSATNQKLYVDDVLVSNVDIAADFTNMISVTIEESFGNQFLIANLIFT